MAEVRGPGDTMKRILALLSTLVALFLSVPWMVGARARHEYDRLVASTIRSTRMNLVESTYDNGWFRSTARTVVELPLPESMRRKEQRGKPVRLTLDHVIAHGPLPLSELLAGGTLQPVLAIIRTRVASDRLPPELEGMPPLQIDTVLPIGRDGESRVHVAAFRRGALHAGGGSLTWQGLEGKLSFSLDSRRVGGHFSAPGLRVDGRNLIDMAGALLHFEYAAGVRDLMSGEWSFRLAKLGLKPADADPLEIANITLTGSNHAEGERIHIRTRGELGRLAAGAAQCGPGRYEIALRNLDAASLRAVANYVADLRSGKLQTSDPAANLFQWLRDVLRGLAAESPEIELFKLYLKTEDGELRAHARARVDGKNDLALQHPVFLMAAIDAEANVTVPAPLAQSVLGEERISLLLSHGFLTRGKNSYEFQARYLNGKLTVNGQPS